MAAGAEWSNRPWDGWRVGLEGVVAEDRKGLGEESDWPFGEADRDTGQPVAWIGLRWRLTVAGFV